VLQALYDVRRRIFEVRSDSGFKNHLAAIRVAAETLSQSDDPDERHKFLRMLIRMSIVLSGSRQTCASSLESRREHCGGQRAMAAPSSRSIFHGM
jgi:hypothetical protein